MGNCIYRQQEQMEEMEMSKAMAERDLMEMSDRMQKILSLNRDLAEDNAKLKVENARIGYAYQCLQISYRNHSFP